MKYILLLGVFLFGLHVPPAKAWSRNGHMIIAAMTYRTLPPHLQVKYTNLLRQHPDFQKWEADFASIDVELSLGEYLFMQASVWPDVIRRKGNKYDHPTWHYTNFPVIPDDFPLEETLTPENDVLFAISESRRVLQDATQSQVDQAAHLSWILHTIGDLHQPLHAVAYVNDMFPEGDRGGNLFYVRPRENSRGVNLHAYWDGLLGTSGKVRDARNDATQLWLLLGKDVEAEIGTDLDYRSWALESREIAISHVYLNGMLKATSEEDRAMASILPEAYSKRAKAVAQKRAVVASLRLRHALSNPS